jgi:flap endonuclease-1
VGTDFNHGIKGIGPKKALKLVRDHGSIEHMPSSIRETLAPIASQVRQLFLEPEVTDDYRLDADTRNPDAVIRYLCGERSFSYERVTAALQRTFGT